MKFSHYLKKLHESPEYKKFRGKCKKAYLCAGFFVIDVETGRDIHQIDYILPNKKIATFFLDDGVKLKISEQAIKKNLPEIKAEIKTDIDALRGIAEDEMKNRTITSNIRKIIAILHILDDRLVWNLQCILDGLNILHVHVDDSDQTILKFEKHSLMDLIRPIAGLQAGKPTEEGEKQKTSKKDLATLQEKIEKAVEKAKKTKKK
jgi:hypothetical protein